MKMDSKTNMKKKSNIKGQNKNFKTQNKNNPKLKGTKVYFYIFTRKIPFRNILSKIIKLKSHFKK